MSIAFEGPNRSGKTYQATRLGWPYHKITEHGYEPHRQFWPDTCTVLDRWWPSEIVYRGLEGVEVDPVISYQVGLHSAVMGLHLVLLMPPKETLLERPGDEADELVSRAYDAYSQPEFLRTLNLLFRTLILSGANPYVERDLFNTWQRRARRYHGLAQTYRRIRSDGWGGLEPAYLLVGDERSDGNTSCYAFEGGRKSGRTLLEALIYLGVFAYNVHIVNSAVSDLDAVLRFLKPRVVVALGTRASERLGSHPHRLVRHPQYIRRFKKNSVESYAQELAGVLQ